MLQKQYEKHNLEMQPYRHYLREYQNMDPKDISRHLKIPFDENTRALSDKASGEKLYGQSSGTGDPLSG